jgi:hypothetical protein
MFYRIMNDVHTVLLSDNIVEDLELIWVGCFSSSSTITADKNTV